MKSFCDKHLNNYMFIKNYNTLFLPEDDMRKIVEEMNEEYCFLYYKFQKHQMVEPYQPFLGWIKEVYHKYFIDETPEQFVKNAKVYPLQQYSFSQYLRTGKAERIEDFFINELGYEKKRMLDSIRNLYQYISSRKKIFMVMESIHLTNLSGINALYHMMLGVNHGNIKIFATYNESYHIPDYILKDWKKFILEIEKQNCQYEWGQMDAAITVDAQDVFIPCEECVEEYLKKSANMYYFLAYEDAHYYLNIINEKINYDSFTISKEQYARFLQIFALIELYSKKYTRVLQICDYIGDLADELKDDKLLYNCNYICAMTQYGVEKLESKVSGYVQTCIDIAKGWNDSLAEYKPELLKLISDCNYWRDIFNDDFSMGIGEEFLERTEKFGFKNILAYICIYCFESEEKEVLDAAKNGTELKYFKKGVELATELENYDLLISAYTKNIIAFSRCGCYEYVEEMYQKKLEAIQIENNLLRMVHTYNGMGYNASKTEKYQLAEEYYCKSLNHLLELENAEEIAITIYNSALNKMLAREYAYASEDLLLLTRIIDILGIHTLTITNPSKFYAMLGICSFYLGEDYRCFYCLNRMDAYVCHLDYVEGKEKYRYWYDVLFMKTLLQAMLYVQDGKFEEAEEKFTKAKYYMDIDKENISFNYPLYVHEKAKFYEILGKEEERERVLRKGIEFCNENKFYLRSNIFSAALYKEREVGKKAIALKREVTNEQILAVVEKLALQKELENSKKDNSFLAVWQELLSKCKNAEEFMPQAFRLLKNHFNFDGVFMIGVMDQQPTIEYMDCPEVEKDVDNVTRRINNFTEADLQRIAKYFEEERNVILTNRVEKGFLEYKELLELIGLYQVVTLFAAPLYHNQGKLSGVLIGYVEMKNYTIANRFLLKEQDLVILKLASEQLHNVLERLNYMSLIQQMNGQLSDMAVTDLLTGLYNRQGFEKLINSAENENDVNKVILYLDLDNFKYYNDTFGHELGDYVLIRFAQVLTDVVKDQGYAVRYGGDEFVLVFDQKDKFFAKEVGQNIIQMIEQNVIPALRQKIGVDTVIPKERVLTCSIGISECKGSESIAESLNNADKALYYVKKSTKNSCVCWEDLQQYNLSPIS